MIDDDLDHLGGLKARRAQKAAADPTASRPDPPIPKREKNRFIRPTYGTRGMIHEPGFNLDDLFGDQRFTEAVKAGRVTLVVAEEALEASDSVRTRCRHIDEHRAANPPFATVFDSLVKDMLGGRSDASSTSGEQLPCDQEQCGRLDLLLLTQAAHTTYAAKWTASVTALSNWNSHRVLLSDNDVVKLHAAIDRCLVSLRDRNEPARNLAERLRLLKEQIAKKRLRGREVEWLSDVTWWSLIDGQGVPLRHEELVTRVSLGVNPRRPLGRAEPVSRTELEKEAAVVADALRPTLGFVSGADSRRRSLESLGRFLQRPLPKRKSEKTKRFPIVFTTTYGLELEYGLACGATRFHVAFPVVCRDAAENRLRWRVQSFEGDPDVATSNDAALLYRTLTTPTQRPRWFTDISSPELDGPLVIKLNGSPLHDARASDDRGSSPVHMVTFDQFDLLQRLAADVQWMDEEQSLFWKLDKLEYLHTMLYWLHIGQPAFGTAARTQVHLFRLAALNTHDDPHGVRHFGVVDESKGDPRERALALRELGLELVGGRSFDFFERFEAL